MFAIILWTAFFIGAAVFSAFNLASAIGDRAALKVTKKNGPFTILANAIIKSELTRLGIFSLYALLGVLVFIDKALVDLPVEDEIAPILTVGGFGMFINSVQAFHTRRAVIEYGEKRESSTTQQPPSNGKNRRVVGRSRGSRLGNGPKRQNRRRTSR